MKFKREVVNINFNIKRLKGFVIKIFLVFLSFSFCLFVLEIVLRMTTTNPPIIKTIIAEGVKIRNIGLNANSHKIITNHNGNKIEYITNADGFRDNNYEIKKASNIFRIIGLGDSMTYGLGVSLEDCYLKVLEKLLNEKSLGINRFEVLNLGVQAYGEKQILELLKAVGVKYQPDLVLLGFYVGNDLSDNMKYVKKKDIEKVKQKGSLKYPFKKFLKKHSKAIAFLAQKWSDFCFTVGINRYGKEKIFMKEYPEDIKEAFKLTEYLIVEINDFLGTYNIELCVIIIPMKFQINFSHKYRKKHVEDNIIIDKPQITIRNILNRNSINYIDLLNDFEENALEGKNLYLKDIHLNSAGHRLAAEEIYKYLITEEVIPISMRN